MVERVQITTIFLADKERNELLLNQAGAIIYTIQPDGTMTYGSPNWPRVLGHAEDEVVGHNFSYFVHPDDHPACFGFLGRIVGTGEPDSDIEMFHTETATNICEDLDYLTHKQIVHLYRIIREALANAIKHARARLMEKLGVRTSSELALHARQLPGAAEESTSSGVIRS